MSAQAVHTGPSQAGPSAQSLVNAPETLGFSGVPLFISSFTDRVNRVRHVQATFKVTNTTTNTLNNLTFLPTSTADTDGDASNNASVPTIAGTPYHSVRLFDGSDATARATDLTAVPGEVLDASTARVTVDSAANPFLRRLDVSGVIAVPPAGLTASVLNYGWRVAPTLAPGESANITFAVDIQNVDINNPKADPYTFSLVFTPAQDDPALAATGAAIAPSTIQGTVGDSALFSGAATLVSAGGYGNPATAISASIGSAGQFSLGLPGTPPGSDFTPAIPAPGYFSSCTFSGTVSNSAATIAAYVGLNAYSAGGDPVATIQENLVSGASVEGAQVGRIYSRQPLTLRGTVDCLFNRTRYDLNLSAGWNLVELSSANGTTTFKDLSGTARSVLGVTRKTPGVTVSLNDAGTITLHPGERVTRNVTFLQVGAFSGTVKLSTNIPGVGVEPSAVTLSPLGTQAMKAEDWLMNNRTLTPAGLNTIRPLSLSTPLTFTAAADAPEHPYTNSNDALIVSDSAGVKMSSTPLSLSVLIPSVYATINTYSYPGITVAQGESAKLNVQIMSVNGLSGPVTVGLSGLPSGVTVVPQTVNVTPDNVARIDLQIVASGTAATGTFTVKISTDKVNTNVYGYNNQTTMAVLPMRTAVNSGMEDFQSALNYGIRHGQLKSP
ncbi:hypothetical protein Q0M94_20680 (plasmid) [Deinococcus radiomollis]|uniref:hypothetical protein n=1 Tax=Deinococcus radiomollis TaxID=468916 RepID=UPI0038922685